MVITPAEAAKMLRKLNEDLSAAEEREKRSRTFNAALGEDVESVRPAYDFAAAQKELCDLEDKVRKLKHALNVFNSTHEVPGFGMTVDQMLVFIPQLTRRKAKLAEMRSRLPKIRAESWGGRRDVIDYVYANYDIAAVEAEYDRVTEQLGRAQLELDGVNSRERFEVPLD